ncbi:MAG: hypothetical protein ACYDFT_08090 [Thermoplasmata archaeon]
MMEPLPQHRATSLQALTEATTTLRSGSIAPFPTINFRRRSMLARSVLFSTPTLGCHSLFQQFPRPAIELDRVLSDELTRQIFFRHLRLNGSSNS